jgi:hypothetical protein
MNDRSSRNAASLGPAGDDTGEDQLLRAWARILREAAEAERSARPQLRVVDGARAQRSRKRSLTHGPER